MSVEIAWKQNILVTDFHLLKSLLVVLGFGSQAFVCGFSRQNINSVLETLQLFLLQNRVYSVARGAVHGAYVSSVLCWRPPAHDGIAQSSPSQLA